MDKPAEVPRRLKSHPAPPGRNSMQLWWRLVSPWRVVYNFIVITFCRYLPFLELKNCLYRRLLGMRVGRHASVGLMVMLDVFFPQFISIGENSIIGYNTTILCHEFLVPEYRTGRVEIGAGVLIGANCTILAGVRIGDGATVAAGSLVNRDVPPGLLAAGVPARIRSRRPEAGSRRKQD